MPTIKIRTDHFFPYGNEALDHPGFSVKQVTLLKFLPRPLQHYYHALDLYRHSFEADVIIGNRRTVLLLGLLYCLYKPKGIALIGYEIIFNFKDNLKNKAVVSLWKQAVRKIDRMVVHTQGEVAYLAQRFATSENKFAFIPFYTEEETYLGPTPDGYVFSAGRMERDFITLLKSLKDSDIPVVIVASRAQQIILEAYATPHTRFFFDIPKQEYLSMLREARLVVISLKNGPSSRGQVVFLEAMKYGKPAICSKVGGIAEYVEDGQTGWLVAPEDPERLRELIQQYFHDTEALQAVGQRAHQKRSSRYSPEAFHQSYHAIIQEVYQQKHNVKGSNVAVNTKPG